MAVGDVNSLVQPAAKAAQGSGQLGKPIQGPTAWTASSALAEQGQWVLELSPQQVDEVLAAIKHATATGKPVQVGSTSQAPTPCQRHLAVPAKLACARYRQRVATRQTTHSPQNTHFR